MTSWLDNIWRFNFYEQSTFMSSAVPQAIPLAQAAKPPAKNQWLASLELEFSQTAQGSRLSGVKRNGPLSVQKAFYPEGPDCAHVYLLHPPAGIVSGDELKLKTQVKSNAHALLTTPGANRFYRAREDLSIGDSKQSQLIHLQVEDNAILEHLPLETIVYEGADAQNKVDVHLNPTSTYIGWDMICLGLPASDQPFSQGRFTQQNRIYRAGKLIFHDRIHISPDNHLLKHPAGLAGMPVFANFIFIAPEAKLSASQRADLIEQARLVIAQKNANQLISLTDINGVVLARYLGKQAEQCKQLFLQIWQIFRPAILGKQMNQPRIWFT